MGGFAQGLGQGIQGSQQYLSDIQNRRQQAELFALKSKQLKLETDMQEKQLSAQNDLQSMLFKGPDMQQVESQGPGAPMRLPLAMSDNASGMRDGEPMWENEKLTRGPGAYEEGPRPAPGQAPIPGTEGVWSNLSPQLQSVAKSILTSTGGDPTKTMQTLQMLAPGVFPKQPIIQKLGEGETLNQIDPNTGANKVLASGSPKYHAPHAVAPGGTLVGQDGQPIFTAPPKAEGGKPKDDIVEVGGVAYQVAHGENGQKTLTPLEGQKPKEPASPKNPVDQYIMAQSNGQYRTMEDASAAGAHDLVRQAEQVVREQRPLDRAKEVGRALTAELPVRQQQAQAIALEKPLAQEKRANLFDRKAFAESGKLVRLPPGTSEGAASRADVIEITDKQMADVQTLDNATSDMNTLFGMADKLIKAKDWKEAKGKQWFTLQGGAMTGLNSDAATYDKDVKAFSTNLARAFGHEKGVLTDADIARWVATIPTFGDTVQTKEAKKAVFNTIKDNALRAQRRVIAGDDLDIVRSELQQKIQPLLQKGEKINSKQAAPPAPAHIPKEYAKDWQDAYMESMQGMVPE